MDAPNDRRRRFIAIGLAIAVAGVCVAAIATALGGSDSGAAGDPGAANPDSRLTAEEATAPLEGAPAELAALREDANQVIEDPAAFEEVLADLRGTPVVINKWASWCGPCRFEFPFFQSQAVEHGDEVAFIGLDSSDSTAAAETFLSELPLPYPSYADPDLKLADSFGAGREFPATIFLGRDGEVTHLKLGGYGSEEDLAADIKRYAG